MTFAAFFDRPVLSDEDRIDPRVFCLMNIRTEDCDLVQIGIHSVIKQISQYKHILYLSSVDDQDQIWHITILSLEKRFNKSIIMWLTKKEHYDIMTLLISALAWIATILEIVVLFGSESNCTIVYFV